MDVYSRSRSTMPITSGVGPIMSNEETVRILNGLAHVVKE